MNWWDRLLGREEKANPATEYSTYYVGAGKPVYKPRNYEQFAKEAYQRNVTAYRAIRVVAEACAGIEWLLYDGPKKKPRQIEEHRLLARMERPNPEAGWPDIIEWLVSYLLLAGNAYLVALRPGDKGEPIELWLLRPDLVNVLTGNAGYEYGTGDRKKFYSWDSVLHLKLFHPTNDMYGLSPIEVAGPTVDQVNAANDWNTALLQQMGRPPGALVTPTTLGPDQFERLDNQIRATISGPKNAGKPMLLDGGMDWKPFGMSATDLDWLDGKQAGAREIASALGVPPELLGDHDNATYSNYQEARKSFYLETVLPLLDKILFRFNRWLVPMYNDPRLWLGYNRDDIEALREDQQAIWDRANEGKVNGILTINEARQMIGKDPLPDGDVREPTSKVPPPAPNDPNAASAPQQPAKSPPKQPGKRAA